jgi:8-oxo-dGTP diphosphatase
MEKMGKPLVGVGLFVFNEKTNAILMAKRKTKHKGYCLPGGHLELYETVEECAVRELLEETNLKIDLKNVVLYDIFNVIRQNMNFHYITFLLVAKYPEAQEVKNMEPDK